MRNGENNENNKEMAGFKMPRREFKEDDNERLDTLGGDDDFDGHFLDEEENKDEKEENLIEVDLEKIRDDEELDIEKRFNVQINENYCCFINFLSISHIFLKNYLNFPIIYLFFDEFLAAYW